MVDLLILTQTKKVRFLLMGSSAAALVKVIRISPQFQLVNLIGDWISMGQEKQITRVYIFDKSFFIEWGLWLFK